ncbi:class I SAM-dependent methyltransferase [Paeniroseomonas aquatica]|uniref:class I SAM-dependent methyltransferase n=1 Tax=Paeniroseomonas aquatica TaxID=373043 RepID=UPI00361C5E0F
MSTQFQYVQSYAAMVRAYLAAFPEDEAVARSVGGAFEHFGVLEHSLLLQYGLQPDSRVIDVGCGAGRLTKQLVGYPKLQYIGLDVVPELLDYNRRKAARADFRLEQVAGNTMPAPDGWATLVTYFSVFTHLLHEDPTPTSSRPTGCWRRAGGWSSPSSNSRSRISGASSRATSTGCASVPTSATSTSSCMPATSRSGPGGWASGSSPSGAATSPPSR